MISSVDGRLVSFRWTFLPNGDGERTISNHYERIAASVGEDGFIIGRKTWEGNGWVTGQRIEASGGLLLRPNGRGGDGRCLPLSTCVQRQRTYSSAPGQTVAYSDSRLGGAPHVCT